MRNTWVCCALAIGVRVCSSIVLTSGSSAQAEHAFNGPYTGPNLNRIAFPIGGMGAGMYALEGSGAISHMSVQHHMDFFNEPACFAAISLAGEGPTSRVARVLEGPVPDWKFFGRPAAAQGGEGRTYGFPRFRQCAFTARFPFATVALRDKAVPLEVEITGWSPFTPPDPDPASLPVGALEYRLRNTSARAQRGVFSFNTRNFMGNPANVNNLNRGSIGALDGGFILYAASDTNRAQQGAFAVFTDDPAVKVDHCWFRGEWWDPLTIAWNHVATGRISENPPVPTNAPGASLSVPFELKPGEARTIRLYTCWYVPTSTLTFGRPPPRDPASAKASRATYVPWYATSFDSIHAIAHYWQAHYGELRDRSACFRDAFYDTTLAPEALEAAAAGLTILKSPTVLRQFDGRLWGWEGNTDTEGSCGGSCAHVWNYAQALCHLFPSLERGLRETGFSEGQYEDGKQDTRVNLPITPHGDDFDTADGHLGSILKAYREWRIAGDPAWLARWWPRIRTAMDYAIRTWDPRETGLPEEKQFNTYDIYYYGPNGQCGSFYLGALAAACRMGQAVGAEADVARYAALLAKGRRRMEAELFNGEYFIQVVRTNGLAQNFEPINPEDQSAFYQAVAAEVNREGPRYQYGTGCLSDGVLGLWLARMCGIDEDLVDPEKVRRHALAAYRYNLRPDLSQHANPQRPAFAIGNDGGLLLCSWPRGGKPLLPFPYSDEVWTGTEYQLAAHLMLLGCREEGLEIVRLARARYDGVRRNPFDEYECGHWYARAMSSYGLLQAFSGARYDAVEKTLHLQPPARGNFRAFLATATGYGTVGVRRGKPFVEVREGAIDVQRIDYTPVRRRSDRTPEPSGP
ncbi:MAG: hypothetical protein K8T26_06240 [Lentisphaerae bacterium]|nr:hypothetical protein [Lentisphaerota bacterium]